MTDLQSLSIEQLTQQFKLNSRDQFTGELRVQASTCLNSFLIIQTQWSLYFLLGRLIWANSDGHRLRRWRRAFLHHDPKLYSDALLPPSHQADAFWEYRALARLAKSGGIRREQAIAVTEYLLCEVIFDMFQTGGTYQQNPDISGQIKRMGEPITMLNSSRFLSKAHHRWQAWCDAELADYSPHLAPYIGNDQELRMRLPIKAYSTLISLIDGQSTLVDIAIQTKQDAVQFTKFLTPLIRKGLLSLRQVPDLTLCPPSVSNPSLLSRAPKKAKVLCIDDNPTVGWQLNQVLTQMGYACVNIQDPLQAIPTLLEQKPNLIFLDLVMPIASGYEICSQIRRISAFKNVPVIILTGNDGIVDRVRAKVVGASDFMAKPVNPQRLMDVVRRYCPLQPDQLPTSAETLQSG